MFLLYDVFVWMDLFSQKEMPVPFKEKKNKLPNKKQNMVKCSRSKRAKTEKQPT